MVRSIDSMNVLLVYTYMDQIYDYDYDDVNGV